MLHQLIKKIDHIAHYKTASAHCDIPCKIYDPATAQIAALSVIRFMDLMTEINHKEKPSPPDQTQLIRLVREKEIHAAKVKAEINVIWGDYFKQAQLEQFPDTHSLVHNIMLAGSSCKQSIDRKEGLHLLALVNEFAASFWTSRNIEAYIATCPYPPAEQVVYPKLSD